MATEVDRDFRLNVWFDNGEGVGISIVGEIVLVMFNTKSRTAKKHLAIIESSIKRRLEKASSLKRSADLNHIETLGRASTSIAGFAESLL